MRPIVKFIFPFLALTILCHNYTFCQNDSNIVFEEPDRKNKSFAKPIDRVHKIGIFLGGVDANYHKELGLAFGLNYRLEIMDLLGPKSDSWKVIGIGMNIENNLHNINETAVSGGVILFISNELWFYFYGGMRFFSEEIKFPRRIDTFNAKPFWRVGASYDIPFRRIIISPSVYNDLIDEELSLTFGISFLYKF